MPSVGPLAELGFYALRGYAPDPRTMFDELVDAERIGLGSVWLSERFDMKDLGTLCGAAAARSDNLGIATGVTNPNTRSLPVLASWGATMTVLSGGRFTMAFGRAFSWQWDRWGLPNVTTQMLGDTADTLRRLWRGERVESTTSLGVLRDASIGMEISAPPPLVVAALGPRTQGLAGERFDGALLHPFWTTEAVAASVARVRNSAVAAGRDPDSVSVWSCVVLAPGDDETRQLEAITRRLTTYLQLPEYGELIVRSNGWDPAVLKRLRTHPVLEGRVADSTTFTDDELRRLRDEVLPAHWLSQAAMSGSVVACARRLCEHLDAGADGVLIHGCSPANIAGVIEHYREMRDERRFGVRPLRPCDPIGKVTDGFETSNSSRLRHARTP